MATRRGFEATGGSDEDDAYAGMFDDQQPGSIFGDAPPPKGGMPFMPTNQPDGESSGGFGNRESARELQGQNMPTTLNLPQGVTVQDAMPGPESFDAHSFDTPMQSSTPAPAAAQRADPYVSPRQADPFVNGTPSGPLPGVAGGAQRRSVSPGATSAIFGEDHGAQMFGQAQGLLGGGRGVQGADAGGPEPTEQMLQILRMLKQQQMV